jgi:DNA-binding transcriptional ArsR family regulator
VRYRRADGEFAETTLDLLVPDEVIGGLPVREFRWYQGRRHYSGWYWSSTTGRHIAYESRLELARIMLADFDPAVSGLAAQPFELTEPDGGTDRRHIPDLLLVTPAGAVTVVDVKPASRLEDPKVRAQFAWTRELAVRRGWGFEQYQARHRSYAGIAAELGVRPETVIAAARRHHIPSRPFTVHSRPEMTTRLEAAVPRDVRCAAEGSLQGWHRLRRFQAAMAFPTIEAAAAHLGTSQSALIHQFRRLERDIGAPLYHASSPGKPMQPTRRGTALLAALDRPDIHALAMEHAPDMSGPASSRNSGHEPAEPRPAAATAQQAAPLFRALAEPTRLAILLALQDGEQRITDLAAQLGATQTAVSSHITVLKDCGLITGRPQGRSVYYRPAQPHDLATLLETAEQLLAATRQPPEAWKQRLA